MIRKKICLLGAFAVGKTSLVARYVHGMFSEKYQTTVGVKIDKKQIEIDETQVSLVVWDLYGEDAFQKMRTSYLRGSSGLLLVADGTRPDTVEQLVSIRDRALETTGSIPCAVLLNKFDLAGDWQIDVEGVAESFSGSPVLTTSAKTGDHVEEAFMTLTQRMIEA